MGNFNNIFEIDSLHGLIIKIEELSGLKYDDNKKYFEIVADHIKSAVFLLGDDKRLSPANTDQGYIIRRLIRRALRSGRQLGIKQEQWMSVIAKTVIDFYKQNYDELNRNSQFILNSLNDEELKFSKMIERGEKILNSLAKSKNEINGLIAFNLFQTHGYPLEMTEEIITEKGIKKSAMFLEEYNKEFRQHQDLSKTASAGKFKGGLADQSEATTKLHTVCHLLLASLQKVLGPQVNQRGSNITAERLRFDFSYSEKMTDEEKKQVEDLVNGAIAKKYDVKYEEMTLTEAQDYGANGVFTSKYGDKVKVYTIGDFSKNPPEIFSKEICGGPHVENIGELGVFKIQKEESSSFGVRRIKAIISPLDNNIK
jgi:alanyl-tRNA synthetase